jgi:hypothetical protein
VGRREDENLHSGDGMVVMVIQQCNYFEGLALAKHVLSHLDHTPSPLCFIFQIESHVYAGPTWTHDHDPICAFCTPGMIGVYHYAQLLWLR